MLRAFALIMISLILVVSMTVAIVGMSVQVLLYPDVYEETLERQDGYTMIEDKILEQADIPPEIVRENLKPTVNKILRDTLTYLRGEKPDLNWTINLNDTFMAYMEEKVNSIPVCEQDQEPLLNDEIVCRPDYVDTEMFMEEAMRNFPEEFANMAEIDLAELTGAEESLVEVREIIATVRNIVYAAIFISIAMMLLIIMLTRNSFTQMTEWLDGDFFLVSLILFLVGYFVKDRVMQFVPSDPEFVRPILRDLTYPILDSVLILAGVVAGVGTVILVAWIVWHEIKRVRGTTEQK